MIETKGIIVKNTKIAKDTYELLLNGDFPKMRPGQFVNVSVPNFFLRRPFSLSENLCEGIRLLYKVMGKGTCALTALKEGSPVNVLCDLGNGFNINLAKEHAFLVGGGIGIAPFPELAKKLKEKNIQISSLLGFNTAEEVFLEEELRQYGDVHIATVDGSKGTKGFVTDLLPDTMEHVYACGPMPMLEALNTKLGKTNTPASFSLEARMGCGFGACMGCSIETEKGPKRVCKEGPVFAREELIWQI